MQSIAPKWGDDYNRRAGLVQLSGSRIEQIKLVTRLLGRARIDEQLDEPLAIGGDALLEIGGAARVIARCERSTDDDAFRRIGQCQLEVRVGDRMRRAVADRRRRLPS